MPFAQKKRGFTHKNQIIDRILKKAKQHPKHIVFPEAEDERILQAASILQKKKLAKVTLVGNEKKVQAKLRKLKLPKLTVIDPMNPPVDYASTLFKLRKKKGLTLDQAKQLVKEPIYYATLMLHAGKADGVVSGAAHPTAHTLRPALQIIKTAKGLTTASSYFMMIHNNQVLFYADCGFNIDPDAKQLAEIALSTAKTAKSFGFPPRVAMLSFSTKGSAHHPLADKVIQATKIVKKKQPRLVVDGELQLDAALVPGVAKRKAPKSPIKGKANVLIFPDLNAGNIAYKLTQRLAHYLAVGPIVQGLKKPVNDLSRGCSVEDIVEVAAITVIQAQRNKK